KRLAALLKEEFGSNPRFRLHTGDAVRMDLGGLKPPPDKFVSNLPYNVATALVMKSLSELPAVRFWCLMLQREIAERLFARPGTPAYGSVSVMTQLLTVKEASRQVPAAVFYPRPRVRSALLAFRRRDDDGYTGRHFGKVRALVKAAFSHRRKLLVNSLAGAGERWLPPGVAGPGAAPGGEAGAGAGDGGEAVRKQVIVEALARAGLKPDVRPQQVTPAQYERLAIVFSELEA
ncbi:MAG: rRNA adenine dimethyltransferase family protein, partial [Actinomycetota bacterium]